MINFNSIKADMVRFIMSYIKGYVYFYDVHNNILWLMKNNKYTATLLDHIDDSNKMYFKLLEMRDRNHCGIVKELNLNKSIEDVVQERNKFRREYKDYMTNKTLNPHTFKIDVSLFAFLKMTLLSFGILCICGVLFYHAIIMMYSMFVS